MTTDIVSHSVQPHAKRLLNLRYLALLLALLVTVAGAVEAERSQVYLIILREQPVHALSQRVGEPYRVRVAELQRKARAAMIQGDTAAHQELADLNADAEDTLNEMRRAILDAATPAVAESQAPVVDAIRAAGGEVIYQYQAVNSLAAWLPDRAIYALEARPDVVTVYPDQPMVAQLDVSTLAIGADTWWFAGETGGPWDLGVVDSGIDRCHLAFQGFFTDASCDDQLVKKARLPEARFLDAAELEAPGIGCALPSLADPTTDDVNGHGTHVAGIGSSGDSVYRGVAYGHDKLFNLKAGYDCDGVETPPGQAFMTQSDAMAAVDWALGQVDTPDVFNLSWGWPAQEDDYAFNRFWDAVVDDFGVSVSAAAGNYEDDYILYPSTAYNVLSVASVYDQNTPDRSDDVICCGSSQGPVPTSGRLKPDLAAPGEGIFSADNSWEGDHRDWIAYSGTSQAAPHVAGALLLALDGGLYSPQAQKALLINTAEDRGEPGWDVSWGWGYLDLAHAYNHRADVREDKVVAAPDYDLYAGSLPASETATLVWNRHVDYAGATFPSASDTHSLTNLDLFLYDADDNRLVDTSESTVDNVEQVQADESMIGVLRVQAMSASLDGVDHESYALAAEGDFNQMVGPVVRTSGGLSYHLEPGGVVTFTLSVTNTGDLPLHGGRVMLDIPVGVALAEGEAEVDLGKLEPSGTTEATWMFEKLTDQVVSTVMVSTLGHGYGLTWGAVDEVRLIKMPGLFLPLVMRNWSAPRAS